MESNNLPLPPPPPTKKKKRGKTSDCSGPSGEYLVFPEDVMDIIPKELKIPSCFTYSPPPPPKETVICNDLEEWDDKLCIETKYVDISDIIKKKEKFTKSTKKHPLPTISMRNFNGSSTKSFISGTSAFKDNLFHIVSEKPWDTLFGWHHKLCKQEFSLVEVQTTGNLLGLCEKLEPYFVASLRLFSDNETEMCNKKEYPSVCIIFFLCGATNIESGDAGNVYSDRSPQYSVFHVMNLPFEKKTKC